MKIPSTASHSDLSNDQKEISKLIEKGLSLHQHGQLAQANKVYERILENQPTHFDALHLSGVIAFQTKNFSLALDLIVNLYSPIFMILLYLYFLFLNKI